MSLRIYASGLTKGKICSAEIVPRTTKNMYLRQDLRHGNKKGTYELT